MERFEAGLAGIAVAAVIVVLIMMPDSNGYQQLDCNGDSITGKVRAGADSTAVTFTGLKETCLISVRAYGRPLPLEDTKGCHGMEITLCYGEPRHTTIYLPVNALAKPGIMEIVLTPVTFDGYSHRLEPPVVVTAEIKLPD